MPVRIDKYIWAIRVYKTRSDATDACKGNKVQINGSNAKPSKMVNVGDSLSVRKGSAVFSWKVLQLTESRLGAKFVPDYALNTTPESEMEKLKAPVETFFIHRDRGTGRPTKKERRSLDALWEDFDMSDFSDSDFD